MSLKAFHFFFLLMAVLVSVGTAAWSFREYSFTGGTQHLTMGIVSAAVGVLLLIYFRWFLKKLRHLSYL